MSPSISIIDVNFNHYSFRVKQKIFKKYQNRGDIDILKCVVCRT